MLTIWNQVANARIRSAACAGLRASERTTSSRLASQSSSRRRIARCRSPSTLEQQLAALVAQHFAHERAERVDVVAERDVLRGKRNVLAWHGRGERCRASQCAAWTWIDRRGVEANRYSNVGAPSCCAATTRSGGCIKRRTLRLYWPSRFCAAGARPEPTDTQGGYMKIGKSRLFALAAAHGASLLAVPPALQAQAPSGQLEEIIVTARQREERIEDVPVSITAFTASETERGHRAPHRLHRADPRRVAGADRRGRRPAGQHPRHQHRPRRRNQLRARHRRRAADQPERRSTRSSRASRRSKSSRAHRARSTVATPSPAR